MKGLEKEALSTRVALAQIRMKSKDGEECFPFTALDLAAHF